MKRIHTKLVVCLAVSLLIGCDNGDDQAKNVESKTIVAASGSPTKDQMRMWAVSCSLCHVAGVAGAPRVANQEDWSSRNEQGIDVLLQHTLTGFRNMPPLGYCMACEEDDFIALIEFMGTTHE